MTDGHRERHAAESSTVTNLTTIVGVVSLLGVLAGAGGSDGPPPAESGATAASASTKLPGAFVGLTLRDVPGVGTVVSWVMPGPLNGTGLESPSVCRPDLIVGVNGKPVDEAGFRRIVEMAKPGDSMEIAYRVAPKRGAAFPAAVDHEEAIKTMTVVLAEREAWSGTLGRARAGGRDLTPPTNLLLDVDNASSPFGEAIAATGLREPIERLRGVFRGRLATETDFHQLAAVRAAFTNPLALPEIAEAIVNPVRAIPSRPVSAAVELVARALDLPLPEGQPHGTVTVRESQQGIFALDFLLNEARRFNEAALGDLAPRALDGGGFDESFAREALALLRVPGDTFLIQGPATPKHLAVLRASMGVDFAAMLAALNHIDAEIVVAPETGSAEPEPLRDELRGAIDGDLLNSEFIGGVGWCVIGGKGANRYDMARIAAVIDLGGDDRYESSGLRIGGRAIIDLGGNDVYTGTGEQGPGSALLGLSLIDDRAGNDRYEGAMLSAGAALFGTALLIDRGGDDVYVGGAWSLGAGVYGAGVLVDLGGGSDAYLGQFLCEGVGGPRGLGALIDDGGRDLYRAVGAQTSLYDTPTVSSALSQGFGFGYRHYASGGIGLLCDLGGDDRYEAGEFAQGGAYFHALGVLFDADGRDLYAGNRYGQGFGVHQAFGALIDGGGDDTYWAMTAADQGAGWDIGAGLLLDRAGDDSYQADDLSQGAAAQQAFAFLVDLAGDDRYSARGGAVQGASGGNEYHFDRTKAGSFSLLMDLGGGRDIFSAGRANSATAVTGTTGAPKMSGLSGVVVDR